MWLSMIGRDVVDAPPDHQIPRVVLFVKQTVVVSDVDVETAFARQQIQADRCAWVTQPVRVIDEPTALLKAAATPEFASPGSLTST